MTLNWIQGQAAYMNIVNQIPHLEDQWHIPTPIKDHTYHPRTWMVQQDNSTLATGQHFFNSYNALKGTVNPDYQSHHQGYTVG